MRACIACLAACLFWVPFSALAVAPTTNLHELKWLVHVDMIDLGASRDLAFYEAIIQQATEDAAILIEGDQGPAEAAPSLFSSTASAIAGGMPRVPSAAQAHRRAAATPTTIRG